MNFDWNHVACIYYLQITHERAKKVTADNDRPFLMELLLHLLANFEYDLLQKIGKLLHDRHGLAAG